MLAAFANADTDVALTVNQRNVLDGLKSYIGEGEPNAEYAQLGFAISNYARNALLLEKYYSNGQVDGDLNLTGVRSEAALIGGLELGKAPAGGRHRPAAGRAGRAGHPGRPVRGGLGRPGRQHRRQVRRPLLVLAGLRRQPGAGLPGRLPPGGLRRRRLKLLDAAASPGLAEARAAARRGRREARTSAACCDPAEVRVRLRARAGAEGPPSPPSRSAAAASSASAGLSRPPPSPRFPTDQSVGTAGAEGGACFPVTSAQPGDQPTSRSTGGPPPRSSSSTCCLSWPSSPASPRQPSCCSWCCMSAGPSS